MASEELAVSEHSLWADAAEVLRRNDLGTATKAAGDLQTLRQKGGAQAACGSTICSKR